MRAHVIENGIVVNTIEVESLDFMPNLVEATEGGKGWFYSNGVFTPPEPVPIIPELGVLKTDVWAIPADAATFATVTFTSEETVYFSVNETSYAVEPVNFIATLEITADAPGPVRIEVRDKQLIINVLEA